MSLKQIGGWTIALCIISIIAYVCKFFETSLVAYIGFILFTVIIICKRWQEDKTAEEAWVNKWK